MVSLSHGGMISLMDNIAEGHDEEVLEWQHEISQMLGIEANKLSNSEVRPYSISFYIGLQVDCQVHCIKCKIKSHSAIDQRAACTCYLIRSEVE